MLTDKDYCDYETCVALQELGYPLTSKEVRYEDKAVFVPGVLLYSAQKWLREEKNAIIVICPYTYNIVDETKTWSCDVWLGFEPKNATLGFNSYEEALSEGVHKAVVILMKKKDATM